MKHVRLLKLTAIVRPYGIEVPLATHGNHTFQELKGITIDTGARVTQRSNVYSYFQIFQEINYQGGSKRALF